MKTLLSTSSAVAALGIAAAANAAFVPVTSFSSFSSTVVSASSMTVVQDELGYLPANGTYSSVTAGTFGFTLDISTTGTNTLQVVAPDVVALASAPFPQTITFTFPNNGTWAVRGFAFLYSAASAVNALVEVNGSSVPSTTLASGNGFFGYVQDSIAGGDITSLSITVNGPVTFTITGSAFAVVPAPGAMALLAAAGLVSTRRRR